MTEAKKRAEALQVHEDPEAQRRRQAMQAVRKDLRRRVDTADFDPLNAMARGLVTEGKYLRALAPTPQLGLMAVPYKRRPALLTPRQLAALWAYHQAWMGMAASSGVVDPAKVRVDGGGAADAGWAMAKACESAREFKRLRAAIADPLHLALVDHVVLMDQGIESYSDPLISKYSKAEAKAAMRVVMLVAAADALGRKIWGLTPNAV